MLKRKRVRCNCGEAGGRAHVRGDGVGGDGARGHGAGVERGPARRRAGRLAHLPRQRRLQEQREPPVPRLTVTCNASICTYYALSISIL